MSTKVDFPTDTSLKDSYDWLKWFEQLQFHATNQEVWYLIDPDAEDVEPIISAPPIKASTKEALLKKSKKAFKDSLEKWARAPESTRGPAPVYEEPPIDEEEFNNKYKQLRTAFSKEASEAAGITNRYNLVYNWVMKTVAAGQLEPATSNLAIRGQTTLQALVRELRNNLAPSDDTTKAYIAEEYKQVLAMAKTGNMKPDTWYSRWQSAYLHCKAHNSAEIMEPLGTKDFLHAVGHKYAPDWASQMITLIEFNRDLTVIPKRGLEDYAKLFYVSRPSQTSAAVATST
ncbi:hypothetical protein F4861DRAFT_543505 [Xylaria intraflava]|nr:hypothetical protein F4861DRAFT_543505 [Xylaria intraflava]